MHTITVHCRPLCDANALLNLFGITRITKAPINMHFDYTLATLLFALPHQGLGSPTSQPPPHPVILTLFAHQALQPSPWAGFRNKAGKACSASKTI